MANQKKQIKNAKAVRTSAKKQNKNAKTVRTNAFFPFPFESPGFERFEERFEPFERFEPRFESARFERFEEFFEPRFFGRGFF